MVLMDIIHCHICGVVMPDMLIPDLVELERNHIEAIQITRWINHKLKESYYFCPLHTSKEMADHIKLFEFAHHNIR